MNSAAMLPGFAIPDRTKNCIDCAWLNTLYKGCTKEDITALEECMQRFFTRRPVLQSTPPRADAKTARMLKTSKEIADAWQVIIDKRRLAEPDDTRPIQNYTTRKNMHNAWMHEWFNGKDEHGVWNLTEEQHYKPERKKTSIFGTYLNNNFGGKKFVMALWQTGIQWAPPQELLDRSHNGALEHVAQNFAKWAQRVGRAIVRHKDDPDTQEARRKSGHAFGKHGLTVDEEQQRQQKHEARANYYWTRELESRWKKEKKKAERTGNNDAAWWKMSHSERWWLEELWSGSLEGEMRHAEAKCSRVQAKDFVVDDDD